MPTVNTRAREQRLRRLARSQGFVLYKSRLRGDPHVDDFGGYRIVNPYINGIVAGVRFEMTLDDVDAWLREGSEVPA